MYLHLFLLVVSRAAAVLSSDADFFKVQLKSDAGSRYIVSADMATLSNTQSFGFALSMSTPLISVAGTNCNSCNNAPSYDETKSTTAKPQPKTGNLTLLGSSASGNFVTEDCKLPATNGTSWSYPAQPIMVSNSSNNVFNSNVSGIFGLQSGAGNSELLNSSVVGGFFGRNPQKPQFSYGMQLEPPTIGSDNAGQLHWLAPDPSAYTGSVTMLNTTLVASAVGSSQGMSSPTSAFKLDKWLVTITGGNNVAQADSNLQAALDPYYPSIYFPGDQAKLIHDSITGSSASTGDNGQSTVWTIPCSTQFSLASTIGGTSFSLNQVQLILKNSDGTCTSYIRGWTDATNQQYLFGSAFMSSLYLIFQIANPSSGNPDQIGFANRVATSSKSSTPIGAIVGGVIGGIALLAFVIGGIIYLRMQHKKNKKIAEVFDEGFFLGQPKVEPFAYQPGHVQEDANAPQLHARTYEANNQSGLPSPNIEAAPLLSPPSYVQSHVSEPDFGSSTYHTTTDPFSGRP